MTKTAGFWRARDERAWRDEPFDAERWGRVAGNPIWLFSPPWLNAAPDRRRSRSLLPRIAAALRRAFYMTRSA